MSSENIISVNENNWQDEVTNSEIPVLVDFWANWCAPCKTLSVILDQLAVEYKDKVKIVSVDVENNMDLAKTHNIRNLPTMFVFNSRDGKISDRMTGSMNKEKIKKVLEKYCEKEN